MTQEWETWVLELNQVFEMHRLANFYLLVIFFPFLLNVQTNFTGKSYQTVDLVASLLVFPLDVLHYAF